jgi:hypothetical protein
MKPTLDIISSEVFNPNYFIPDINRNRSQISKRPGLSRIFHPDDSLTIQAKRSEATKMDKTGRKPEANQKSRKTRKSHVPTQPK